MKPYYILGSIIFFIGCSSVNSTSPDTLDNVTEQSSESSKHTSDSTALNSNENLEFLREWDNDLLTIEDDNSPCDIPLTSEKWIIDPNDSDAEAKRQELYDLCSGLSEGEAVSGDNATSRFDSYSAYEQGRLDYYNDVNEKGYEPGSYLINNGFYSSNQDLQNAYAEGRKSYYYQSLGNNYEFPASDDVNNPYQY